jgi:hypothetical protein
MVRHSRSYLVDVRCALGICEILGAKSQETTFRPPGRLSELKPRLLLDLSALKALASLSPYGVDCHGAEIAKSGRGIA